MQHSLLFGHTAKGPTAMQETYYGTSDLSNQIQTEIVTYAKNVLQGFSNCLK